MSSRQENRPVQNITGQQPDVNSVSAFWPNVRDALLQNPRFYEEGSVACGICREDLSFHGQASAGVINHVAYVLTCGHIFGASCLEAVMLSNSPQAPPPCPICRAPAPRYQLCSHSCTGRVAPVPAAVESFPRLLSEGGRLAERCWKCQMNVAAVEMMVRARRSLTIRGDLVLSTNVQWNGEVWNVREKGDPAHAYRFMRELDPLEYGRMGFRVAMENLVIRQGIVVRNMGAWTHDGPLRLTDIEAIKIKLYLHQVVVGAGGNVVVG
ncbi:hypothetical protein ACJ41O_003778 [Fusarium nematophilum]